MRTYQIVLFATLAFVLSCEKVPEEVLVSSVSINQAAAEMIIGETVQLSATVLPSNATEKSVIWSSSKQSVATITNSGLVTAIAEGNSTITASCGGKSATCQVTINKGYVAVTSVTLNKTELTLEKGKSESLTATVNPSDATDKTVTWSSSNSSVASVDSNGKITAIAGGNTVITAKAGNQQATCNVTVIVPVESISLDREDITLEEESSTTLVATVKPDDATDKKVNWTSSNTQIATVDETGKVTAIKEGSATIIAKAGEKSVTCSVTVQKKVIAVTSITLNKADFTLEKGQSETLLATVKPDDATDKTISWSTSDSEIATVDNSGKVTAIAGGNVTIRAKAGEKEATCVVTVVVPVESITLDQNSVTIEEGQTVTLTATVLPEDATDKTVTWSSTDETVVKVENGIVSAIKEGAATVTAKSGGKTATCMVTVKQKVIAVTSVTLNKTSLSLEKGESETLVATVKPDDATDKTVTWSSSDTSIATVDSNGKVTAVAGGSATITAKAGEKEATCAISVTVPVESVSLDETSLTLEEGQSVTLIATVKPDDATDKTVTWSSSNTGIATVDMTGKVIAIGVGEANILAKAGEKTAICLVIVKKESSQVIAFEDANFKAYCVTNFDTDGDGEISMEEARVVESITVNPETITSLKGIEYFTNLERLSCNLNWRLINDGQRGLLTSIDLSNNTSLKDLSCKGNQISTLDVSGCTGLTLLSCGLNELTSLDISNCTALETLDCSSNQLTSLDVSNCTALASLSCGNNQLSTLDISYCSALESLTCNYNQLTTLDIGNCTALTHLQCEYNQLTTLDVSGCTALTKLYCNNNQLTTLDIGNCTALTRLYCPDNQLSTLDVSGCTALAELCCNNNRLTSLDISNCTVLYFLQCCYNQLTSLDISNCTALFSLICHHNQLSTLDLSGCTVLESLDCQDNQLTTLDVSNNTILDQLNCIMNPLEEIWLKTDQSISVFIYPPSTVLKYV